MNKRNSYTVGVLKDHNENKRHPNSIVALIRGIVSHWQSSQPKRENREKATPLTFLKTTNFLDVYFSTLARFKGIRNASGLKNRNDAPLAQKNIAGMLEAIGAETKHTSIEYYHLRAFADFVGVPTSALLLYSELCSLERRATDSSEFLIAAEELLATERDYIDRLQSIIQDQSFEGLTFAAGQNPKNGKSIWISDVHYLKEAAAAFDAETTKTWHDLMARE